MEINGDKLKETLSRVNELNCVRQRILSWVTEFKILCLTKWFQSMDKCCRSVCSLMNKKNTYALKTPSVVALPFIYGVDEELQ